jgi:hypothetical protein
VDRSATAFPRKRVGGGEIDRAFSWGKLCGQKLGPPKRFAETRTLRREIPLHFSKLNYFSERVVCKLFYLVTTSQTETSGIDCTSTILTVKPLDS